LQQLQQSDLLQHLAAAMSHTTHRIWELQSQAGSDVLAAQLADSAYDHKLVWGPSSSSLQQLHMHAGELCACAINLERQLAAVKERGHSGRWHKLLLPVAAPAMELLVLTIQHVSTCLELLPARVILPPKPLWRALWCACYATKHHMARCSAECSCCAGLRQQMLQSPYHLPATCIALLVAIYATLIHNDAQAWWDAAASSSSSQQQGQQGPKLQARWEKAAWELACSRHDALPASHYLLLQLAGCSSKALLWAAAQDYNNIVEADLMNVVALFLPEDSTHLLPLIEQEFSNPDLVPATSAAFLRLAVLLHWGWHYWQNNHKLVVEQAAAPERSYVLNALLASSRSFDTVRNIRGLVRCNRLLELQERQQQQQQKEQQQQQQQQQEQQEQQEVQQQEQQEEQQQEEQQQEEQQQERQEEQQQEEQQQQQQSRQPLPVLTPDPSGLFFPVPVYLQVLDDVLLLANRLLTMMLPMAAAPQQLAQATNSNSSHSASSGDTSSSNSSASQASRGSYSAEETRSLLKAYGPLMIGCLQGMFLSCTALASHYMTEYAGMQSMPHTSYSRCTLICCPEVPVLREDAPIWFQHAAQMCQVLEAYVRATARSQAVESTGVTCPLITAAGQLSDTLVSLIDPTEQGLRGPLLQAAAAAGPGSKEQQQLHGLLCSVSKWAGNMGPSQQWMAEQLRVAVAVAAANMLLAASRGYCKQEASDAGAASSAPAAAPAAAAAAAAAAAETVAQGDRARSSAAAASGGSHLQGGSAEQPA
jgi:hypothetical protein